MSAIKQKQDHNGGQLELAAVFRQRAEQLAQRGRQDASRRAGVPVLVLRIADERFGIELANVEQVFPRGELTPVPGAPLALVGVANLSGAPRSVFDLSRLLNMRPSTADAAYIVLLNVQGKMMGLAVEAVEDVRRFETNKMMPLDEAAANSANGLTKGLTDDHVAVLDAISLLQQASEKPEAHARGQKTLAGAAG